MDFGAPLSALQAFSTGMQVSAHNIANVNTDEFHASRARFAEAEGSRGVTVSSIQETTQPGGYVQSLRPTRDAESGRVDAQWRTVEASNTDLAREMVGMISYQRGFQANTAVVRTMEQMQGTLLDMIA